MQAASYVFNFVPSAIKALYNYWQSEKGDRLEPVSTICMLAMRTLKEYKDSLPAVKDSWFQFDKKDGYQGLKRSVSDVDCLDLAFLEKPICLFVSAWPANQNPDLVPIVQKAVEGLAAISLYYQNTKGRKEQIGEKKLTLAVDIICRLCQMHLQNWLQTLEQPRPLLPMQLQHASHLLTRLKQEGKFKTDPGIEPCETALRLIQEQGSAQNRAEALSTKEQHFVQQIAELWKNDIKHFKEWMNNGDSNVGKLEGTLSDKRDAYMRILATVPPSK